MKILVTGGAGFIGSHICKELVKRNNDVYCLDNFSAGKIKNIEDIDMTVIKGDVTDIELIDRVMKGIDVVYNVMASKKTVCLNNPLRDTEVNATGTLNLLLAAKKHGVKKFIHSSTGSVYGEQLYTIDENTNYNPVSYYGVSKLAGDRYVNLFKDDFETTILRYFHVYGANQDFSDVGGVVAIFINKILNKEPITIFGTGKQVRSFTYVEDVVTANINAVPGVFNIASGIKVTIDQLARDIMDNIGIEVPIIYKERTIGDIDKFDIDNLEAESKLNIQFTNYKKGLNETILYYRRKRNNN